MGSLAVGAGSWGRGGAGQRNYFSDTLPFATAALFPPAEVCLSSLKSPLDAHLRTYKLDFPFR